MQDFDPKEEGEIQTPEQILRIASKQINDLDKEAQEAIAANDLQIHNQRYQARAKIIESLPTKIDSSIDQGQSFPADELQTLRDYATLANRALESRDTFAMSVLLVHQGSKTDDPTELEKLIERIYSQRKTMKDLITTDTSTGEFENIVDGLLTDKDRKILGEDAVSKASMSLLSLSVFAPEPATFDRDAYMEVVAITENNEPLPQEEALQLVDFDTRVGVLKTVGSSRYAVDKDSSLILGEIFSKYEDE